VGFVVPRPGRQPAENELLEHCRNKLAAFKVPAAVVIVEAIPKEARWPRSGSRGDPQGKGFMR
jgi:acyl-coenzyme A synthetase/AMP-(fatty) acid ligase